MELFYVTENITLTIPFQDGNQISVSLLKPTGKSPDTKSIYAATGACVEILRAMIDKTPKEQLPDGFKMKMLDRKNKQQIYNLKNFPIVVSNFDGTLVEQDFASTDPLNIKMIPSTPFISLQEKIKNLDKKEIRVTVVNGMGTGLGDGIVGLRALNIFYNQLKQKYKKITIDLGHTIVVGDKNHQDLYSQEAIVNRVFYLPLLVSEILEQDLIVDNSAMIIRDNFGNQHMIDFYLETLAIDPKSVPAAEKRVYIKNSDLSAKNYAVTLKAIKQKSEDKLILLHCSSSAPIRSIPRELIKKTIKTLLDADKNYIVVTTENLDDIKDTIDSYLGQRKNRHVNLKHKGGTFSDYAYLISQMDGLVTTDTSSYHIADAFSIPTVVIFQTIDPKKRIAYYPFCEAVSIDKSLKLENVHVSSNPEHLSHIGRCWKSFDAKDVASALKRSIIKKKLWAENKENHVTCSVCNFTGPKKVVDKFQNQELSECSACGSEFSLSRNIADYANLFNEPNYGHYLIDAPAEQIMNNYMSQIRFEPLVDFLKANTNKGTSLDYGCANGFLVAFCRSLGYDAHGIDINKAVVEFGRKKFEFGNKIQLGYQPQHFEGWPEKFSLVTSFELVEHLEKPRDFAKAVFDVLEPGGYWVFSTPNRNRIQMTAGVKNTIKHSGLEDGDYPPEHLQRMYASGHVAYLKDFGFEIVHQTTSRTLAAIVNDVSGQIPNLQVSTTNGEKIGIPSQDITNVMYNHIQPFLNGVEGHGNFLVTICRKPLK